MAISRSSAIWPTRPIPGSGAPGGPTLSPEHKKGPPFELWVLGEEGVDPGEFVRREPKLAMGNDLLHLLRVAPADDGSRDSGVALGPGDSDDTGRNVMRRADLLKQVSNGKIASDLRFLVVLGALAEVVFREGGDAFASHGPGQQAGVHRSVGNGADVMRGGVGKYLLLNRAVNHGVRRLVGGDRCDLAY